MTKLLYPKIANYQQEWLSVSAKHQLYIEQSGNPIGIPVLYLHGGPGAGSNHHYRRYFDPDKYRIILIDQRGCGRSIPSPSLHENTTSHLIDDIEKVRKHLAIEKWLICGGSWGTTLALLYGIKYPSVVSAFILRGIFLGTKEELNWLYGENGAALFFPEYYREFVKVLPENKSNEILLGYAEVLNSYNEVAAIAASKAWYLWELRLSSIEQHHVGMKQVDDPHQALCMAKISCHYFTHNCFLADNFILNNLNKICSIPAVILHGRYDMVCQLAIADRLVNNWPSAELQIIPQAGHSGFEAQTIDAFCKIADSMAIFLQEQGMNQ